MSRQQTSPSATLAGVAVFGGSDVEPGSATWERARGLGRELGRRGVAVVTGGYGGVMEAASRGAREAGGEAVGVTCRQFRGRSPNPALTLEIEEPDLMSRTDRLFRLSRSFVVLEGRAGTLGELGMLWAFARAGLLAGPIVLWDDVWARMFMDLERGGRLDAPVVRSTAVASSLLHAVGLALEHGIQDADQASGGETR